MCTRKQVRRVQKKTRGRKRKKEYEWWGEKAKKNLRKEGKDMNDTRRHVISNLHTGWNSSTAVVLIKVLWLWYLMLWEGAGKKPELLVPPQQRSKPRPLRRITNISKLKKNRLSLFGDYGGNEDCRWKVQCSDGRIFLEHARARALLPHTSII